MPDDKISAFTELTVRPDANDWLPIVDISDTTQNASGSTKKISFLNAITNVIANDIAGKANTVHTHAIAEVINLQTSLNAITVKTDYLTVPSPVNTDTLKSDIATKANIFAYNNFNIFIPYEMPITIWTETISIIGISPNDIIFVSLGDYTQDSDHELDTLDLTGINALPIIDALTLTLQFAVPTSGTIKLKWRKI